MMKPPKDIRRLIEGGWIPEPGELIEVVVDHDDVGGPVVGVVAEELDQRIRDLADQLADIIAAAMVPGCDWLRRIEALPIDRAEALDRIQKLNFQRPGEALTRKE